MLSARAGRLALALATLALCSIAARPQGKGAAGADWPLFRGNPLQTGVASSDLPAQLAVRWKFAVKDRIESSAAIVEGVVYFGSYDEHLYALNLKDGSLKWKRKLGPIKAAPSVKGGVVYVGDEEGFFHAVTAADGKPRWKFETGGEITSSANFVGDRVLFGSGDSMLYCLTTAGKELWKIRIEGGPVNGSPAVVEGRTFVGGCDSRIHVIDAMKGKELASVELDGQTGATAAVGGDHVFIGTMQSGQLQAVNWKKAEVTWTFEPKRPQGFYSSPALTDKLVIVGGRDRLVHAVARDTGKLVWSFPTKNRVDGSAVVVGRRVFIGSLDGNLYALDLAKGTELQRWELGRGIVASPAVGGGCLVIGTTDGVLYCLGQKE